MKLIIVIIIIIIIIAIMFMYVAYEVVLGLLSALEREREGKEEREIKYYYVRYDHTLVFLAYFH